MKDEMMFSAQTRLTIDHQQSIILDECSRLLSSVERSLYAEVAKGHTSASCKNFFLTKFQITARQFNACRVSLEGKIAACEAGQERALIDLQQKIETIEKHIQLLQNKPSKSFVLHQKKRRQAILINRLNSMKTDKKEKRTRLCFGGKKLFNAQFYLEKNGFASHSEWKDAWQSKRNSEFFVLGSKDESSGNQTCKACLQEDGTFSLRLRLPNALEERYGKYIEIKNVAFAYGQAAILAALHHPTGQALSYRFKKDEKGWRVFVSVALTKPEQHSLEGNGCIGVDLNADHIAYVETDRFGNIIAKETISWVSYGKTTHQLKALTGDVCKKIVDHAQQVKKTIVIEKLDFQKKKMSLGNDNKKFARLLSSFSYKSFFSFLIARAFKNGITVHQVNPAFTSVIGRFNYARRYGLSTHLAAALCIARRYKCLSEAPCPPQKDVPDGKGSHVAFVLPERNRTKHVWHFWAKVKKKFTTVLAAHYRAMRNRSSSPTKPTPATNNSR